MTITTMKKPTPKYDELVNKMRETMGVPPNGSGLVSVYAYHCERCNYVWLPRDFDFNNFYLDNNDNADINRGRDLFSRKPPKSCARCKSRSWRDIIPKRKVKKNHVFSKSKGWDELIRSYNVPRWVSSRARIRSIKRRTGELTKYELLSLGKK
jgi:hypothetical protein